jgi:hypothetical protein
MTGRNPKIGQFGDPVLGQQDVRGFDIPVNDASRMDGDESLGHLSEQVSSLGRWKWTFLGDASPKRATGHELEDDERSTIPSAVPTNPDDVRRADGASQINLAREPLDVLGVVSVEVAQHLYRHYLAALVVTRLPHDAHRASPDLFDQLEALSH